MTKRPCVRTLTFVFLLFAGCAADSDVDQAPIPPAISPGEKGIIVVAAGDISCDPSSSKYNRGQGTPNHCRMQATSDLAVAQNPAAVLLLGDNQYEQGSIHAYQNAWVHNWGRKELREITYPAAGNHEYKAPGAKGYFDFFGPRAGDRDKGYYSFNLGTWHLVALNSGGNDRCRPVSCEQGADQERWLRKDLEANNSECTLAFWHRPLFTSGLHRNATETRPFWRDLYEADTDVILNGHSHQYERFAPQDPDGGSDPERGIIQFVVGTGGKNLKRFWNAQRNSLARLSGSFGVLKLELKQKTFAWEFIAEGGQVLDRGAGQCHPKRQHATAKAGAL
jgi:acid phosphatase type 7